MKQAIGYMMAHVPIVEELKRSYNNNGYDYLDLNLPSGNAWATTGWIHKTGNSTYYSYNGEWGGDWRIPTDEEFLELLTFLEDANKAELIETGNTYVPYRGYSIKETGETLVLLSDLIIPGPPYLLYVETTQSEFRLNNSTKHWELFGSARSYGFLLVLSPL